MEAVGVCRGAGMLSTLEPKRLVFAPADHQKNILNFSSFLEYGGGSSSNADLDACGDSHDQVRLKTRTETPISSTPIVVPTNVTRYSLSQILNHLLENPTPIPYNFLIDHTYLPSTLDEYITSHGISREE